jgi:hypothetical protein
VPPRHLTGVRPGRSLASLEPNEEPAAVPQPCRRTPARGQLLPRWSDQPVRLTRPARPTPALGRPARLWPSPREPISRTSEFNLPVVLAATACAGGLRPGFRPPCAPNRS